MKKILIIEKSRPIREFLKERLTALGLTVFTANNGLDGSIQIKKQNPHLIIMDFILPRVSSIDLLRKKTRDPELKNIPVILLAKKTISKEAFIRIARFGIKRLFPKPIKINSLLKTISSILNITLDIDNSPCIIDVHFNENILFIEIARGLNLEKINVLQFKIEEILRIYKINAPGVLIMMTNIDINEEIENKINIFLTKIKEATKAPTANIQILSTSKELTKILSKSPEFKKIGIKSHMVDALDHLLGIGVSSFVNEGLNVVQSNFLTSGKPLQELEDTFQLQFETEDIPDKTGSKKQQIKSEKEIIFAVVESDLKTQKLIKDTFNNTKFTIKSYISGEEFLSDLEHNRPDLLFIDLLLPDKNGFSIIKNLKTKNIHIPIIMTSPTSKREIIIKALNYGVNSYLLKPLTPEKILFKVREIFGTDF